jgi:hypothetical protein
MCLRSHSCLSRWWDKITTLEKQSLGILEYLLLRPGFYNISKVFVEVEGSTIRGMYLAYSVKGMKKLMRDMAIGAFSIFKRVGLAGSLKMISRFGLNSHFPKLSKNGKKS